MKPLYIFKHIKTGLYFNHENDVEDIDKAETYKITTYAHFFVDHKMSEYKAVILQEEKLRILRIKKLKNI
jgi:hypothetical protein